MKYPRIVLSLFFFAIFVAATWYLISPLFLSRTVDEALPFDMPAPTVVERPTGAVISSMNFPANDEIGSMMPAAMTITDDLASEEITSEANTEEAAPELAPTAAPVEDAPAATPHILAQGRFVDGDAFHKGSGVATLYRAPDGTYLLRFEEFVVTNGPDLHVILSPSAAPTGHASLGDYIDLGSLKGNIGDQNYTLPADFDPTLYKSVVIYCLPFQVIFATATLE